MFRRLILAALLLCLAACGRTPLQEQQAYVFGTRVEVLVVSEDPEQGRQAISAVLREFDRLHRAYHAWQASELTVLNAAIADGQPLDVKPELADFVREAQALAKQGDYLFDPGIGQLIKLWGFQADEFKAELPPPADIKAWLAGKPSIADLGIAGNTISSRNRKVALDFGGYLKGVALDRAAAILKQQGIHNALINIGGNIMALGSKQGKAWRVGIQHPRQPGPMATVTLADGEAIGTSGDYQRYFEVDGKRYARAAATRLTTPRPSPYSSRPAPRPAPCPTPLPSRSSSPVRTAGAKWRERWKSASSCASTPATNSSSPKL
jgi:thiamine biosynthesis lipoprotein